MSKKYRPIVQIYDAWMSGYNPLSLTVVRALIKMLPWWLPLKWKFVWHCFWAHRYMKKEDKRIREIMAKDPEMSSWAQPTWKKAPLNNGAGIE